MAEATDRPPSAAGETAKAEALPGPAWPAEGVTLSPAPQAPPAETYRPLSGLALASFLLAGLYAVAVALGGVWAFASRHPRWLLALTVLGPPLGAAAAALAAVRGARALLRVAALSLLGLYALLGVGGLVAYSHENPWLLPGWTVLVPLAAAVLAWFARGRIRDSEGTLGGGALAAWALGLSLFFGLTYAAYYAGAYVAVRQQAQSFSRGWIELIKQGKLEDAFVLTMAARDRPHPVSRDALELRFMGAAPAGAVQLGPSGYGLFCQTDFIRAIHLGGPDTQVRPLGIVEWTYKAGSPQVQARYRIETDVLAFDLIVTALGSEAKAGEAGGRQWQILLQTTGRARDAEFQPTDKGRRLMRSFEGAGNLAQTWLSRVGRRDWDQAYLETLPPAERERQHQAREACDPAVAVAAGLPALAANPQARDYLAGRARLFSGDLIRADKGTFWAPTEHVRERALTRVRQAFSLEQGPADQFELKVSRVPYWERDGGRLRFLCDGQVQLMNPGQAIPAYMVEIVLVVEGDAPPDGFPGPDSWRVVRLDLVRGRTGGQSRPMPQQGGRGGPPPGAPR